MEVMLDGQLVTCTPEEYMELKRLGAFGDKPTTQGAAPKLGDGYDEWLKQGQKQVVAVYGCNIPFPHAHNGADDHITVQAGTELSADTMARLDIAVGNIPMIDGKYIYDPATCTPGTFTCGRCSRDEYCEKAHAAKKGAARAHRDA